jgi:hypothetical protein
VGVEAVEDGVNVLLFVVMVVCWFVSTSRLPIYSVDPLLWCEIDC